MGILRSEPMKHGTLVLPIDRARQFIDLIGAHTKMMFEDMNARDMHRPYKKYIQRIDEMERILRFLMDELTKVPGTEVIKNNVDSFLEHADDYKLDEVEARLKQIYQGFILFKENNAKLTGRRNAALEERYVVQTAIASMAQTSQQSQRPSSSFREDGDQFEFAASRSLLDDEEGAANRRTLETMFSNIAGVIPQAEQDRFARTLWRATRGNTFTHFQQIFEPMQDPKTGREVHKSVFVIYFQDTRPGSSISAMSEKITKICSSYGVNTYRWPMSRTAAEEMRLSLQVQVEEQGRILKEHENYVRSEAAALLEPARRGGDSLIEEWRMYCAKEKAIYATLNLFEGHMNLRANCWYPEAEEDEIRRLLIQRSAGQGNSSAMLVSDRTMPRKHPPTYIRKNDFTRPFQDLVDTIGLPRYQEANAALFTIVTFPFLFGVMFGDVGHGTILMVGIYAIWKADELKFSLPGLYEARYLIFMMGFFAVYVGMLYNDIFSLGLNLFASRWDAPPVDPDAKRMEVRAYKAVFDTRNEGGEGPYPFGVDPAWHGAQNELVFMNSLKMKLSVILGVTHMLVGLLLRFLNALHFRNFVDFFCECVPMMVFMCSFFGFMDLMILHKWVTPMENPPSVINSLISMAMWTEDPNPMFGENLPRLLMVITMLCVPVMLIPKPLIIMMQHKAEVARRLQTRGPGGFGSANRGVDTPMSLGDEEALHCPDEEEEEEFDIMEVTIHQVIETIEYTLGTVSHTASYLRLWALSLAHQQLSVVFFNMTILNVLGTEAPWLIKAVLIYFAFGLWFGITVAILLFMDTLECFLHTMRLHWIEFQSKFYKGDGYPFTPYRHRDILTKSTEE
eukprot:CAMPEP_0179025010 /NCGR_PEP_ID=MMETSP0796-20121207/7754_1 /TAXON_ID=73915 /ORGANISM="Pyrodinium bahamense, Strain pbaha01" /LENGTH=847 /DNA_ID=CAMNT_0020720997 /DNA_START=44 /DNA_END=2587 /DNA_ORIENTATION=+